MGSPCCRSWAALGRAFRARRLPLWPQSPGCWASARPVVAHPPSSTRPLRNSEAAHPPLGWSRSGPRTQLGSWRAPFPTIHSVPFLPDPDSTSKMPDVEEKVPLKDPGNAESGPCKPETSGRTPDDRSSPKDHPSRRCSPATVVGVRWEGARGPSLLSPPLLVYPSPYLPAPRPPTTPPHPPNTQRPTQPHATTNRNK